MERFYLFDIARPNQYMYGTSISITHPETVLIDTDPFLAEASSRRLRHFRDHADQMRHR